MPGHRLHVPERAEASPPLLVVLHGCTQDARDVAAGTRLDDRADRAGFLVLYPEQRPEAHPQRCWRWFDREHQRRGRGEPGALMDLVDRTVREHGVDRERVYLAGISAGGGMAVVLAALHPGRFAGVAVHSGVPYGAVSREEDAPRVLEGGGPGAGELARRMDEAVPGGARPPRLLAIHGTADDLVSPENTRRLVAAWLAARRRAASGADDRRPGPGEDATGAETLAPDREERGTGGGGGYPYEVRRWGRSGRPDVEAWIVERLGHAWSGGDPAGTFTDPAGPDATGILLRFFGLDAGDAG